MTEHDSSAALAAVAGSFAIIGVISLVLIVFALVIYWRIATKAGYPGAYSLLMLVPLVNFLMLILFAFTEWPIERALRAAGGGGGYGGGGTGPIPGGYGGPGVAPGGYLPPTSNPPAPGAWGSSVGAPPPPELPPTI